MRPLVGGPVTSTTDHNVPVTDHKTRDGRRTGRHASVSSPVSLGSRLAVSLSVGPCVEEGPRDRCPCPTAPGTTGTDSPSLFLVSGNNNYP